MTTNASLARHSSEKGPQPTKFRKLLESPSLHQDWGENGKSKQQEERKVSWSELFFDLFYVVACINLGHVLEEDLSLAGFGKFFLYFTYFWNAWVTITIFQSRIKLTGLVFDYTMLVYMLGLLGMILHCSDSSHHKQFAAAFAVCRTILAIKNFIAAATIPRAVASGVSYGIVFSVVAVVSAVGATLSWHAFVILSIVVLVFESLAPILPVLIPAARIPLHVDHAGERYGLLMMIFLGETVIGLGQQKVVAGVEQYAAIILAATICYNLHLLYYHGHPDQDMHALRIHRYRGFLWTYAHWFLGGSFLLVGVALRMVVSSFMESKEASGGHRRFLLAAKSEEASYPAASAAEGGHAAAPGDKKSVFDPGHITDDVAWLLCISYGLALHLLAIIRASHYLNNKAFRRVRDQLGLQRLTNFWWALVFVWPFAAYFIAFANDSIHGIGLLAYLAAHGIVFNFVETFITHKISQHDWASLGTSHRGSPRLDGQKYIPIEGCREEFMKELAGKRGRHSSNDACEAQQLQVAGKDQDAA